MAQDLSSFLSGTGRDRRGRSAADVLAMSDEDLERHHDYIQWLFPLPTRSAAVPGSPVLSPTEIETIRTDPQARLTLDSAAARMIAFYRATDHWLTAHDHNHLRITRILQSLKLLIGPDAARSFHDAILARHEAAGSPVNPRSLRYWADAVGEPPRIGRA